jgi:hypothetical protein
VIAVATALPETLSTASKELALRTEMVTVESGFI